METESETLRYAAVVWEPDDLVEIRPLPDASQRVWTPAGGMAKHLEWMRGRNARGNGVYAGVLPRIRPNGGTAADTDGGRVVWIDCDSIDADAALASVRAAGVPAPCLAVNSGHGAHIYWKLAEKLPKDRHLRLLKALYAYLRDAPGLAGHVDPKTQEAARVLRLPGFINHKPPVAECRIAFIDSGQITEVSAWGAVVAAGEAKAAEPRASGVRLQTPGTTTPSYAVPGAGSPKPDADGSIERRAIAYLDKLPPAISGQGGHNAAYNAARVLAHDFALPKDRALALLLEHYNPRCEPPWTEWELRHKVEDAVAKPHERSFGHLRDAAPDVSGVDASAILAQAAPSMPNDGVAPPGKHGLSPVIEMAEAETGEKPDVPRDPGPFPARLLEVPGFLREVTDFCLSVAFSPQPVLALGGAISLQAVLAARKIADVADNRTNLYVIGIAPGSSGKDRPLKVNREILYGAGAGGLEGSCDFASDAGLLAAIAQQPAILFQIDEIGRMLRSCGDARSAHLWNISTQLVRLFSCSESVFKGKAYADSAKNREIIRPCASLFGVTVGHHYYESLTRENLIDGLVARLLVFEGDERPCPQKGAPIRPPDRLLEVVRWWRAFNPGGNLAEVMPSAVVLPESPGAAERFAALAGIPPSLPAQDDIGRVLWGRAKEKACRLALVYASARDRNHMGVDDAAAEWGCELASYSTRRMLYASWSHVADNLVQKNKQRILRMLKEAPGGKMTRSQLVRKTQDLRGKERDELLEDLAAAGLVRQECAASAAAGPPARIVRLV